MVMIVDCLIVRQYSLSVPATDGADSTIVAKSERCVSCLFDPVFFMCLFILKNK